MHLNLQKYIKMQDNNCKKYSNTKKPIILQDTNRFNVKQEIQCSFQPKTLQSKGP